MDIRDMAVQPGSDHKWQVQLLSRRPQMNLGNKLAVGEAVDPGIDEVSAPGVALPEPAPAAVVVATPEEPVPAHAER
jgi:hypothetical protein